MRPPTLPPGAVEHYETLRAQAVNGGGQRSAFARVLYHGMYHGLAQLADAPDPQRHPQPPSPANPALVRQLANMILNVQSELTHVY